MRRPAPISHPTRPGFWPSAVAAIVVLAGVAAPGAALAAGKKKPVEPAVGAASGWAQLQSAVMGYADNFVVQVSQVTEEMAERLKGEARVAALRFRLDVATSAYFIAANPNPEVSLLDLIVLTNLAGRSLAGYWIPEYFGEEGRPLEVTFETLEKDVWELAQRTIDENQEVELRRLLDDWSASHRVEWRISAYERFSDFAEERLQAVSRRSGKKGGLFGALGQVTEAADAGLLVAERSLFLLKREPVLLVWQVEELIARLGADPELHQALEDASILAASMERLVAVAESLPQALDEEAAETLEDIERLLDEQRRALIQALEEQEPVLRALLDDSRATLEAGSELAGGLEAVNSSTDTLLSRLGVDARGGARLPSLDELRSTLAAVTTTSQELTRLLESFDSLLRSPALEGGGKGLQAAAERLESVGDRFVDRLFRRALVLLVMGLIGALGTALIYRWLASRLG